MHNYGPASAGEGAIWAMSVYDVNSAPLKVPIMSANITIHPHGIGISNQTDLLYVVNHAVEYSSVEVFQIHYSKATTLGVQLEHVHTVRSDMWGYRGINDVVEGKRKGELYVTQWLPFGHPEHGTEHPQSWTERLAGAASAAIGLGQIPMTLIFRCKWSTDGATECTRANNQRLQMANGITTTTDRSQIFVADFLAKVVLVFQVTDNNAEPLKLTGQFDAIGNPDNIEYDPVSGDIIIGSLSLLHVAVDNEGKPLEEHTPSPGAAVVAKPTQDGGWDVTTVLQHDGHKLSVVSAAARVGSTIILGSVTDSNVLVCKLD